jgi:thiol:disulfide interchange protein DsbD
MLKAPSALKPGERQVAALLKFQGCEEKLCLRPEEHELTWDIDVTAFAAVISKGVKEHVSEAPFSIKALLDKRDFYNVVSHGRHIALLAALIAGILTGFSPCVWPLIPVTLLIIGIHKKGHFLGNLGLSAALVAGIALTYSALGVAATSAGRHVGFLFQQKAFLILVIAVLVAMSTALLGLWTFQLPVRLQNALTRVSGRGYRGSFLSGISLGLLATPCAGPILVPMLLWVASEREYLFGAELLALYAVGMGVFYIIIGTFYGTLSGRVKNVKIGNVIKKLLGAALLVPAVYYLLAVVPFGGGLNGDIKWQVNEPAALVEAAASKRPLMIVFGAKWCPPCDKIKKDIFAVKEFAEVSLQVVPLYVDATVEEGEAKRLMDKYHVVGMPTILFVSPEGRIYDDLSVAGSAPTLSEMIEKVSGAAGR